jgi:ATP-binding cassette subfamily F protein 3
VEACAGADPERVRTLLACLKLPRALAGQRIGALSLGERAKTALVRLLVSGANVLLLDEPTNHLEIEAQVALEEALRQYPGAVLLVSHDRRFAESVADRRLDLGARFPEGF